jgi:hypothetical protein
MQAKSLLMHPRFRLLLRYYLANYWFIKKPLFDHPHNEYGYYYNVKLDPSKGKSAMTSSSKIAKLGKGLCGAAIGSVVGYFGFIWLYNNGFYAMILPGAALGAGFSFLSRTSSKAYGALCGSLGIVLGLFSEWQIAPFKADDSFVFLVTHFYDLGTVELVMIGFGGLFAFWLGGNVSTTGKLKSSDSSD